MAIKHIFTPLTGDGDAAHVPLCALRLAEGLAAHVTAAHTDAVANAYIDPIGDVMAGAYAVGAHQALAELRSARRTRARNFYNFAVAATKVPFADTPMCKATSTSWLDESAPAIVAIPEIGRLSDLIAINQPSSGSAGWDLALFDACAFGAGRPVLVLPHGIANLRRDNIAIAWNGSAEAANAVARAIDLLEPGATVTVIQAGDIRRGGIPADRLIEYLGWHCFVPTLKRVDDKPKKTAETILEQARAAGAGILVMGAYSHSRMRESILGGVTQHMLLHSDIPLLLAH